MSAIVMTPVEQQNLINQAYTAKPLNPGTPIMVTPGDPSSVVEAPGGYATLVQQLQAVGITFPPYMAIAPTNQTSSSVDDTTSSLHSTIMFDPTPVTMGTIVADTGQVTGSQPANYSGLVLLGVIVLIATWMFK